MEVRAPPGLSGNREERLDISVDVVWVVRILATGIAVLALLGAVSAWLRLRGYETGLGLINLFNLDIEMSAPTWFSSSLLLACAALLATLGMTAGSRGDRWRRNWLTLAAIFVALSIDEVAAYHESWIDRLRRALDAGGLLYFTWVVPAAAMVALLAGFQLRFLRALPRRTAVNFVVAGAIYVGAALGLEMVSGWHVERRGGDNALYAVLVSVEEILEMVGALMMLRALLLHVAQSGAPLRFAFASAREHGAGPRPP